MGKKILLVADDEEMSREVIKRNFSDMYEVLEASNGREALNIIHSSHVDIVILDIFMPEVTGYEVLQQVKCDEKYSDLRILVATSVFEKTERNALELGADDIVFKPYDPIVIKKRMNNLLTMQDQKRELEKALLKAEQANKAKTDFLSRISHDMRTPLNGILGITTLIKDTVSDPDVIQDVEQIEMSGKYLLNLVNDTLDVNRIETGKLELHPTIFDGRSAVNNMVELIRPNVRKKNIEFNLDVGNLPFTKLYMDMGRLEQIFMNILGNAVKFTPIGGNISVSITNVFHDDNKIIDKIVISDNGVGMSKDFLPHLFEAFAQENAGMTGNTTGTGLGMTITKQVIDLMGGDISVQSEIGKGTTFTIILPMTVASDAQIKEWNNQENDTSVNFSFAGKKILLCEDHLLNAEIAIRILEKRGMIVDHAVDGVMGLEMYKKSEINYYDLILMDIRMPRMDGLEATRNIRGLERKDAKNIPIVAMTANAFYEDIVKTKQAGMDAHLGKPIDVEELYQCIAELLHVKRQVIKRKILIVDDIPMNRSVIKSAIENDFDVFEAGDGQEALEMLKKMNGADVIITDIQMPNMNGMQLIKEIRKISEYKRIPIIANTQFGDPEQEEEILKLGANDFVYKPTTPKIIELRIRNVMKRL